MLGLTGSYQGDVVSCAPEITPELAEDRYKRSGISTRSSGTSLINRLYSAAHIQFPITPCYSCLVANVSRIQIYKALGYPPCKNEQTLINSSHRFHTSEYNVNQYLSILLDVYGSWEEHHLEGEASDMKLRFDHKLKW